MKFTEERKEELRIIRNWKAVLQDKERRASSHIRILSPHTKYTKEFTDRENYSYWKGYARAINELWFTTEEIKEVSKL